MSNDGKYRILPPSVNFAAKLSPPHSISSDDDDIVNEISESFFGMAHGLRSNSQKVSPSMNGMASIINMVLMGEMPTDINAAYENDPKMPAPPVPLDLK